MNKLTAYIQTRATDVKEVAVYKGYGVEFDTSFGTVRMVIQRAEYHGNNFHISSSVKGVENTRESYRVKSLTKQSINEIVEETKWRCRMAKG